ncbi:hypothetical protein J0X14_12070 [Muricauda sp. CAU 1633]|uniref:hypothetical protein n=1 Tax=Allomuricauda sp. CAU 1633 TaxID=2816036 RepID=UPI001A9067CE|nr:hypothetical protein [Muricauda sp. CAU 1633]MBO0323035.1 hypothetical protein [Muricauda sp. CAU 1633]
MMRKTKTQFKPISLGRDERSINEVIRNKKSKPSPLAELYRETKELVGKDMDQLEFFNTLNDGFEGFAKHLREQSNLPNATADILFQMHGISKDTMKNLIGRFRDIGLTAMEEIQLNFKDGEFFFPDEVYKEIEKRYSYETQNQTQNDAFELLSKLGESLDEVIDKGFVRVDLEPRSMHGKTKYTILKELDNTLTTEQGKIVPNRSFILGLQEA